MQIKEGNRSVLKFCAYDSLRCETKAIAIKAQRLFQVVDAERNEANSWLYLSSPEA